MKLINAINVYIELTYEYVTYLRNWKVQTTSEIILEKYEVVKRKETIDSVIWQEGKKKVMKSDVKWKT